VRAAITQIAKPGRAVTLRLDGPEPIAYAGSLSANLTPGAKV
jgi:hypothetical protein